MNEWACAIVSVRNNSGGLGSSTARPLSVSSCPTDRSGRKKRLKSMGIRFPGGLVFQAELPGGFPRAVSSETKLSVRVPSQS
jgi:hypothetical protein